MLLNDKMIKLMKNTFYQEEKTKKALCEFISNAEILSLNKKCKEFEEEFSKYQERKYSVLFNSGSSANLALIQALLNLKILNKGDNVGFTALTWATNVMPLVELGLNPFPIDISLENLNVNLEQLLNVNEKLDALFITNVLGFCGNLDKIKEYCDEKKIIFIEDNCESLGGELNGKKLGNFGLASTFSFFVGHHLSTIEGGMICTDNLELYNMLLMVRSHGWDRNLSEEDKLKLKIKHQVNDFYRPYTFYCPGYNLRPTEITAFIGLEQLKYLNEIHQKRFKNFDKYNNAVRNNQDILKLKLNHMNFISNFAYPLIFKDKKTFEKYKLKFSNVEIRPIIGGSMTKQPFLKNEFSCPNAEQAHELGFYIPNNPYLTEEEINYLCERLIKDNPTINF